MAYADYKFYIETYNGEHTENDSMERWLEMASDELDHITSMRLMLAFPQVEAHAVKVKKAVCAIADALFAVDYHRRAAAPQTTANGSVCGAVTAITSGKESISYGGLNAGSSVYISAASSQDKLQELITSIAVKYVSGIPDATGVNLLYRGVR